MGRLLQLELENFKSYGGNQVIGPFHDFTCVVGPNGAGKSNLMDAISFVLGLQSKQLRSANLKELIFKRDESSQLRRAVVRLLYVVSEGELEDFAANTTIVFARTVSSNGTSSYQFQNANVTYEHYESILQKIGVLVKVRNFLVFQGDIEAVASKSPNEITQLFEQISGSDALVREYEEVQKAKVLAEEAVTAVKQRIKMFTADHREIRIQRDEANLYHTKQAEVKDLQTTLLSFQLFQVSQELRAADDAVDLQKDKVTTAQEAVEAVEGEVTASKKALAVIGKRSADEEKRLASSRKKLDAVVIDHTHLTNKAKILTKRKKDTESNIAKTEKDMEEQEEYISTLTAQIGELEAEIDTKRRQLVALEQADVRLSSEDLREYNALKAQAAQETLALNKELQDITTQMHLLTAQRDAVQLQSTNMGNEQSNQTNTVKDYQAVLKQRVDANKALETETQKLQSRRASVTVNHTNQLNELTQVNNELMQVNNRLNQLGYEKSQFKHNTKLADALNSLSGRHGDKLSGKLGSLVKPRDARKYSVAINLILNKYFDAIVVQDKDVAADSIRYLKEHHVGVSTFLPLDSISPTPISQRFRDQLPAKYRLAIDVLDFDPKYQNAVLYAVGNAVICDTLEDARELSYGRDQQVKIVTLKGQVISKSGAMTGGHTADLTRDRFSEVEVTKLQTTRRSLEARKADLERVLEDIKPSLHMIEVELRELAAKIHYNNLDVQVYTAKHQEVEKQLRLKADALKTNETNINRLTGQIENLSTRKNAVEERMRAVEGGIFRDFSNKRHIENIITTEAASAAQRATLTEAIAAVTTKLSSLRSQVNYARGRQYGQTRAKLQKQLVEVDKQLADMAQQIAAKQAEEQALRATVKQLEDKHRATDEEREVARQELQDILSHRNDLQQQAQAAEAEVKRLGSLQMTLRNRLHDLLEGARMGGVELPLAEGEEEAMEVEEEEEEALPTEGTVHYSDADDAVVLRDRKLLDKMDLSHAKGQLHRKPSLCFSGRCSFPLLQDWLCQSARPKKPLS